MLCGGEAMPAPVTLALTEADRTALEDQRDHHPKAYLRERAAALLKVAAGVSGRSVALTQLLKRHAPGTVYTWIRRFQATGVAGLRIRSGRGRRPAFQPDLPDASAARELVLHVLHQPLESYALAGSRWTLAALLVVFRAWRVQTRAGLWQLLRRLKIRRKRARPHVHSPDRAYGAKLRAIHLQLGPSLPDPTSVVFVFEDEFTLFRHPSLAPAYEQQGHVQPLAELGWKTNATWRWAAALNAWTGQVTFHDAHTLNVANLVKFYTKVQHAYPAAQLIKLAQDNWPVHVHPDVLAALQPQAFPWGLHRPGNWPTTPSPKALRLNLPIQLWGLPTYASWTNPIEKLWRLLRQAVLHVHRFADDWLGLRQAVAAFLAQFAQGSVELLRYVGLSDPTRLYQALFTSAGANGGCST
jgi:transposase